MERCGSKMMEVGNAHPHLMHNQIVEALVGLGVREAFGIPGGAIVGIHYALSRAPSITLTLCQSECGAAYMAMGRSQANRALCKRGEIPVCFGTSGPGITNMITGIAAAYEERVPVLLITGGINTRFFGKGAVQDATQGGIDAIPMFDSITAASRDARSVEAIIPELIRLYHLAAETQRPVHLNIPVDLAAQRREIDVARALDEGARRFSVTPSGLSPEARAIISRFCVEPERPLVFAGHGIKASGLIEPFRAWIRAHQLPVLSTVHAKGLMPSGDPLFVGDFGFAADPRGARMLEAYRPDGILFLGTRLGEISTQGWSQLLLRAPLKIHVDRDPTQLNRVYEVEHPIRGELASIFEIPPPRAPIHRAPLITPIEEEARPTAAVSGRLSPSALVDLLGEALPEDAVVMSDIGNSMAWLIRRLRLGADQRMFIPFGLGAMGNGICSAIGIKSACPSRPIICVTGDGSMMMHGAEIFTARERGLGVVFIVLNDGGHGMVAHGARLLGFEDARCRFERDVDFCQLAAAFGVDAYRITRAEDWRSLPLEELWARRAPTLIEVLVDPEEAPPIGARTKIIGQGS